MFEVEWGTVVGAGDPPIMPDAIEMAEFSPRSRAILNHFNDAIRVGPNPIVRNADLARVISSFIAPDIGFARTVQGLVSGEMKGVAQEMRALKDRYDAALDTAFEKARADGAQVNRADLVFSNWDPDIDFAASDY